MGVTTTADEQLDEAVKSINIAIKHLSSIVIDECWGYDDWNEEYTKKIHKSFKRLIKIRKELNR